MDIVDLVIDYLLEIEEEEKIQIPCAYNLEVMPIMTMKWDMENKKWI